MPKAENDKAIGPRLRSYRSKPLADAGRRRDRRHVPKYEKGTNHLSGANLVTICELLKTTPDALLGVKANGKGRRE